MANEATTETAPAPAQAEKVEETKTVEGKGDSKPEAETKTESTDKPTETKGDDGKGSEAEKSKAPEKYELKVPEDSLIGKELVSKIETYAKENDLTNKQAQELLEGEHKSIKAHVDTQKKEWLTQITNDKELGGDKLNEHVELSKRVVDKFGSPALRKELERTGYGNHPELVRMLVRIGKASAEDKLVIPDAQPGGERKSAEEVLYGAAKK